MRSRGARSDRLWLVAAVSAGLNLALLVAPFHSYAQKTRSTPSQPRALADAAALLQAGHLNEAEVAVRAYLGSAPRDANAHILLGVILDQRGQQSEAEQSYKTALKLDAKSVAARSNLGVLFARTNRIDQAIEMFEAVLRLDPTHEKATFNLGALYSARGNYGRAIPLLERAVKQQTNQT